MAQVERFTVNDEGLHIQGTVLRQYSDISDIAPAAVDIKTDSTPFCFAGKLHVSVRTVELNPLRWSAESNIRSHNPVSVKHKTQDVERFLFLFRSIGNLSILLQSE